MAFSIICLLLKVEVFECILLRLNPKIVDTLWTYLFWVIDRLGKITEKESS